MYDVGKRLQIPVQARCSREGAETFSEEINESLYACAINDVVVDFINQAKL
jgi:hypothetical protein